MGEKKIREKRKARLLRLHKNCIFCGGARTTSTLDHVLPRASFPRGYHPDEFDFPACNECNQSTRDFDQVFSLYAMLTDHDEFNHAREDIARLVSGIANNYPKAVPKLDLSASIKRKSLRQMGARKPAGMLYKDIPLAGIPLVFGEAARIIARKLTCAIFFTEFGQILPPGQKLVGGWHHVYDPRSVNFVNYFNDHVEACRKPTRGAIKQYGDRLIYKFAYNEEERFFGIAVQFGKDLFLWSLAARSDFEIAEDDPNQL